MRAERGFYDLDDPANRSPDAIRTLGAIIGPLLRRYFRSEVRGLERVPDGAGLYVGNHNGGFDTVDTYIFGEALLRSRGVEHVPYGLGHEVIFSLPVINQLWSPLGVLRASHENARRIFDIDRKVLVYPGGDVDAFRPFRDRHRIVFDGRVGYIRLALREGVPIIPVVAAGAHSTFVVLSAGRWLARLLPSALRIKVWPITVSLPWGLTIGPPPPYLPWPSRVLIEALEPVRFEHSGEAAASDDAYVRACADRVEGAMQATLTRLADELRG